MRPSYRSTIKDFAVCLVAAYVIKYLSMDTFEKFMFTGKESELKKKRKRLMMEMMNPCLSTSDKGDGCAETALCWVFNSQEWCKVEGKEKPVLVPNYTDLDSRETWLDEYSPLGFSTSEKRLYGVLFVIVCASLMQFLLVEKEDNVESDAEYLQAGKDDR